jgi:hypothetical protein
MFNVMSAREGELALVYQSLYRTISEVFPSIDAYATLPNQPNAVQNIIVVASNDKAISENGLPDLVRQFRCREAPEAGLLLTDDYAPTDYLAFDLNRAIYPARRSIILKSEPNFP